MLAQVILIVRTPFKGQRAIWAQEGTYSSVDTLMDLGTDKKCAVNLLSYFLFPDEVLIYSFTLFDISPVAEKSA